MTVSSPRKFQLTSDNPIRSCTNVPNVYKDPVTILYTRVQSQSQCSRAQGRGQVSECFERHGENNHRIKTTNFLEKLHFLLLHTRAPKTLLYINRNVFRKAGRRSRFFSTKRVRHKTTYDNTFTSININLYDL